MEHPLRRPHRGTRLGGIVERGSHWPQAGGTGGQYAIEQDLGDDQVLVASRSAVVFIRYREIHEADTRRAGGAMGFGGDFRAMATLPGNPAPDRQGPMRARQVAQQGIDGRKGNSDRSGRHGQRLTRIYCYRHTRTFVAVGSHDA
jgi:hypothetical protein